MTIPRFALGMAAGAAIAAAAPRFVASASAQPMPAMPPAPAPLWVPPVRYQYHVMNMGWGSESAAEATFNSFGQDGWHVAAISGSWVTFERSYPTR